MAYPLVSQPLLKGMSNKLGPVIRHYGNWESAPGKNGCQLICEYVGGRLSERNSFRPPGGHIDVSEEVLKPPLGCRKLAMATLSDSTMTTSRSCVHIFLGMVLFIF